MAITNIGVGAAANDGTGTPARTAGQAINSNFAYLVAEIIAKANKTNVLELDNTTVFTPDADYEPATKKYVDDNVGGSGDVHKVATPVDNQIGV